MRDWVRLAFAEGLTKSVCPRMQFEAGEAGETREVELEPGDIIGRMSTCALRLDDPRISEAHALVSRRREGLVLLALRGRLSVDGKPRTRVALEVGKRVVLASFMSVSVTARSSAEQHLGVVSADPRLPVVPLARVVTLYDDGRAPVGYFDPEGAAHVLGGVRGPRLRRAGVPDVALQPDSALIGACRLVAIAPVTPLALSTADRGQHDLALRIVVRFDSVQITTDAGTSMTLDGIAARVVTELAEIKAPVAWTELARLLWKAPPDAAMRHRWDQLMLRIRQKLREAGVRSDLVRPNRNGLVELVLGPDDRLQIKT